MVTPNTDHRSFRRIDRAQVFDSKMNIDLSNVKLTESLPLTSRDQHFFSELTRFMNVESAKVGDKPSKERFSIFRLAFEKVTLLALSRCTRSSRLIVFEDH